MKTLSSTPSLEGAITAALAAGRDEAAAVMLRRAFGREGAGDRDDLPELLEELAEYYLSRGRPEDAMAAAGRAVLMTPVVADEPELLRRRCRIGEILLKAGLVDEACAVYASLAEEARGETWIHELAGSDYVDADEHELAFAWLTAGLEFALAKGDPDDGVARLAGLRRISMSALGLTPDALDRQAQGRCATPDAHAADADDLMLIDELEHEGVAGEATLRLLHCLRRAGSG